MQRQRFFSGLAVLCLASLAASPSFAAQARDTGPDVIASQMIDSPAPLADLDNRGVPIDYAAIVRRCADESPQGFSAACVNREVAVVRGIVQPGARNREHRAKPSVWAMLGVSVAATAIAVRALTTTRSPLGRFLIYS